MLLTHLKHNISQRFTRLLLQIHFVILEMLAWAVLLPRRTCHDEAKDAKVAFISEVDSLSHFLPSTCELLRVILSERSRQFGFTSTLVFAVAEEVDDESDELFAGLVIDVSFLKLREHLKQGRLRNKGLVYPLVAFDLLPQDIH